MDETYLKKFRNLVSTCPRPSVPWTELSASSSHSVEATRQLVSDFLYLVSGDQVSELLDDVLSPRQKDELPALGDLGDEKGSKRLAKLNWMLKRSPPMKPWTMRGRKDEGVTTIHYINTCFKLTQSSAHAYSTTQKY